MDAQIALVATSLLTQAALVVTALVNALASRRKREADVFSQLSGAVERIIQVSEELSRSVSEENERLKGEVSRLLQENSRLTAELHRLQPGRGGDSGPV